MMDVVYRRGEATAAQVREGLADPPSDSAVRTTLRILEEKGHLTHRKDGPRFVFSPTVPPGPVTTPCRPARMPPCASSRFAAERSPAPMAVKRTLRWTGCNPAICCAFARARRFPPTES